MDNEKQSKKGKLDEDAVKILINNNMLLLTQYNIFNIKYV